MAVAHVDHTDPAVWQTVLDAHTSAAGWRLAPAGHGIHLQTPLRSDLHLLADADQVLLVSGEQFWCAFLAQVFILFYIFLLSTLKWTVDYK
jgi:hypothetical protein